MHAEFDNNELCKSIMILNKNIKSVVMIGKSGIILEKIVVKNSFTHALNQRDDIRFMECVLDVSLGKEFDDLYGPIRYHHSERDDFIMFSFPFDEKVIIVSSTKNISPISLATKIGCIVMKYAKPTNYLVNKS